MSATNSIVKNSYKNDKQILIAPELAFSIGCIVNGEGVQANAEGKKIIKAGTPVGATASVLTNRQTVLSKGTENAQGVVLHDVDVTLGEANATLVIDGYVDLKKLDTDVVALVTEATSTLKNIKFINGSVN